MLFQLWQSEFIQKIEINLVIRRSLDKGRENAATPYIDINTGAVYLAHGTNLHPITPLFSPSYARTASKQLGRHKIGVEILTDLRVSNYPESEKLFF